MTEDVSLTEEGLDSPIEYHPAFTGTLTDPAGVERHFINGAYGRDGDEPSVIYPDGTKCWYRENPKRSGFRQPPAHPHRDGDLPAIIRGNGDVLYYKNGKLHRDGGQPAIILHNGTKKWFEEGDCVAFHMADGEYTKSLHVVE